MEGLGSEMSRLDGVWPSSGWGSAADLPGEMLTYTWLCTLSHSGNRRAFALRVRYILPRYSSLNFCEPVNTTLKGSSTSEGASGRTDGSLSADLDIPPRCPKRATKLLLHIHTSQLKRYTSNDRELFPGRGSLKTDHRRHRRTARRSV